MKNMKIKLDFFQLRQELFVHLFGALDVVRERLLTLENQLVNLYLLADVRVPKVQEIMELFLRSGVLFGKRGADGALCAFFGLFHAFLTKRTFLYPFLHH